MDKALSDGLHTAFSRLRDLVTVARDDDDVGAEALVPFSEAAGLDADDVGYVLDLIDCMNLPNEEYAGGLYLGMILCFLAHEEARISVESS